MGMQLPGLFATGSSARAADSDIAESTTTKAANFHRDEQQLHGTNRPLIDNESRPFNYVSAKAFAGKT